MQNIYNTYNYTLEAIALQDNEHAKGCEFYVKF